MSKRMVEARKVLGGEKKIFSVKEALEALQALPAPKFDESFELALHMELDPKKADQAIRGTIILPHGTGKSVRVLVFATGEPERQAKEAGADFVGSDDLMKKVEGGWLDFDTVIATPDLMREVGKLGKVLGPRGLMPSPKAGTVTMEVKKAVEDAKQGKVEFKLDKQSGIHLSVGKRSFSQEALEANIRSLIEAIWRAKPASAKGRYVRSVSLSTSMSPGLRLDPAQGRN